MDNKVKLVDLSQLDQLSLRCPLHKQYINGIKLVASKGRHLKCFLCVKDEKLDFDNLVDLSYFQKEVLELQTTLQGPDTLKFEVKANNIDYLDNLNQLQQKVNGEKSALRKRFDDLIQQFTKNCDDKYENICNLLDKELEQLSDNITNYNNHIKDCTQSDDSPLQQFLINLTKTTNIEEYEKLISQFVSYQGFCKVANSFKSNPEGMGLSLGAFQQSIEKQLEIISKESEISLRSVKFIDEINQKITPMFNQFDILAQNIKPLTLLDYGFQFLESKILVTQRKDLLTKLAQSQLVRKIETKLIYRGSDDGFEASSFHSKCDKYVNTLTLVSSVDGFTFGGYSDQSFNQNKNGWMQSSKSFIFSVDRNEVYPIFNYQYAVFAGSGSGPRFGVGNGKNDLCIEDECNKSKKNHTSLGTAYKERGVTYLTNEKYFQVKEIEVYEITFL